MPPRNRILLEQRQRIIQAFEDVNEDYLTVAATIEVNRTTARSIVARCLRERRIAERPRGGANHVRVDDEMRNCLNDILNENCLLTLAQINQELRQRLPRKPTIHDRTVAKERLSQARLNLDPNDHVIFIYDGTPAHNILPFLVLILILKSYRLTAHFLTS